MSKNSLGVWATGAMHENFMTRCSDLQKTGAYSCADEKGELVIIRKSLGLWRTPCWMAEVVENSEMVKKVTIHNTFLSSFNDMAIVGIKNLVASSALSRLDKQAKLMGLVPNG